MTTQNKIVRIIHWRAQGEYVYMKIFALQMNIYINLFVQEFEHGNKKAPSALSWFAQFLIHALRAFL